MKRLLIAAAALLTMAALPTRAQAYTIDFCVTNAAECTSDGYSSVLLTLTGPTSGNVWTAQVDVTWIDYSSKQNTDGVTDFLSQIQISLDAANKNTDYDSTSLDQAPGGTGSWTLTFGNVPNCGTDPSKADPCAFWSAAGTGYALDYTGGTATFKFTLDLAANVDPLSAGVNVRLGRNGDSGFQGNFSPNGGTLSGTGGTVTGTGGTVTGTGASVPEPTTLMLLGSAFAITAGRLRRRKK